MTLRLAQRPGNAAPVEFGGSAATRLDIGLVNNMPDAALDATERQFRALFGAATARMVVRVKLYTLPDVPRADVGRRHVSGYGDIADLWDDHLDGLIVTGTEPRASNLKDEPYWGSLARLVDWAEDRTHSTIWSCLAAHAAVLHLDGIERRPLDTKRFGVFECARVSDHPLTAIVPSTLRMPHSRWNDIPEDALHARGYRVITRSNDAGVDAFMKQRKSLFVFFQGHPEYSADTLLLEYRRDVKRFLRGERETYPPMPQGYFDEGTTAALEVIRERAIVDRREERLADFPTDLAAHVTNTWRPAAASIYRNWLRYLCVQKERRLSAT
jgi:homoserine O-succinyltransferase